jgi:RNAse (barnase) inhibitor barstar
MREIVLSGARWTAPDDFYEALLPSLGAPDWHGHNLDALWDSITGDDINQIKPPFRVRVIGSDAMPANCKALVDRFVALISDARAAGIPVEVVCE